MLISVRVYFRLRKLTEDNFAHLNSSTSHNWKANSNRGEVQVNKLRPIDRNARIGRKANIPVDIDRYFDNEAALSGRCWSIFSAMHCSEWILPIYSNKIFISK